MTDSSRSSGKTTEQLRNAIDRGATGSKVPYPDPAAAPLGTDDEAAGTAPDPESVGRAYRQETANAAAHRPDARDTSAGNGMPTARRHVPLPTLLLAAAAAVAVIVLLGALLSA